MHDEGLERIVVENLLLIAGLEIHEHGKISSFMFYDIYARSIDPLPGHATVEPFTIFVNALVFPIYA